MACILAVHPQSISAGMTDVLRTAHTSIQSASAVLCHPLYSLLFSEISPEQPEALKIAVPLCLVPVDVSKRKEAMHEAKSFNSSLAS